MRRFVWPLSAGALVSASLYPLFIVFLALFAGDGFLSMASFGGLVFLYALPVALVHAAVLGLPALLLLERWKLLRAWSLVLAGFSAGALPVSLYSRGLHNSVAAGLLGASGAAACWLVLSRSQRLTRTKAAQ